MDQRLGAEALEQRLDPATRRSSHCGVEVRSPAAKLHACPELDTVAIRHLDDSDPGVVLDAINAPGKYGGAAVEAPLWKRFEKWHEEWKDRAAELQPRFIAGPPNLDPSSRIGPALRDALALAPGWLTDAEKLKRIRSLCLTDSERQQLDSQRTSLVDKFDYTLDQNALILVPIVLIALQALCTASPNGNSRIRISSSIRLQSSSFLLL